MQPFNLINTENYEELSKVASEKIIEVMKLHPSSLFCFAGGDTPVRTLELLVQAHREKRINLCEAYYIGLDEWVGLDELHKGSCLAYMKTNLFDPVNVPKEQIHFFNAKSSDLEKECELSNNYIKNHQGITLSLLGVGVNGHLGFNEPGTSFESLAHVVDLNEITKKVGEKYFENDVNLSKGITLGIKQLLESDYLILEASGETKRDSIKKLMENNVTSEWPITALRLHKNCAVIVTEILETEI
ncbi:glucosamine-6-phosphate deaminase [Carnobacterium iners]|uniref:Glucosamine-6-phosphate deaminase n=1 Tax=Carnobacterium iners TaxID=1073423 RepID=A0A1X7MU36_9LACT|nr:glucosamine-6-phosphate deaminase [Carnobacterium iners]SEK55497.1 glucosamine-6-phosphate deaminase [Carnobacterium iners]SMH28345.1 glucosamine-6-phosphate deaminase [Carnobacterium iners]